VVGSSKRVGFEAFAWNEALTDAAYPRQKQLPANYQYPPAASAAPARPMASNVNPAAAAKPKAPPPPPSDAPPGFRF
jgi:hypothetical protein